MTTTEISSSLVVTVLVLTPSSQAVLLTKVSLLLHLDNYSSALALLDSPSLANSAVFERAYCLYKLGREDDAEEVLQTVKGKAGEGGEFLEAQLVSPRFILFSSFKWTGDWRGNDEAGEVGRGTGRVETKTERRGTKGKGLLSSNGRLGSRVGGELDLLRLQQSRF